MRRCVWSRNIKNMRFIYIYIYIYIYDIRSLRVKYCFGCKLRWPIKYLNWRWGWLVGQTHAKKMYSWHGETLTREIDALNSCRHWQISPTDASKSAKERLVLFLSFSFCLASFFSLFLCVRFFSYVFPKSFHYPLTWQEYIVSAHSRKVVYLFIVGPIIHWKLWWRIM